MADVPPVHLLVDCDPGIDDALALAVVAAQVRAGRVVLHGIVAVGGNVGLDDTAANARFLAERFDLAVPVLAGAAVPLAGTVPGDAAQVHGTDGLGGLRTGPVVPTAPALLRQLADLVDCLPDDASSGERVVLATGPLTNLAKLVQFGPELAGRIDRVVVMGGAFGDPGGNVTPHAEFNVWIDSEAWAIVAAAGLALEVVPLDVTMKVVLDRTDVEHLVERAGGPTLVSRIVDAGIDLYADLLGEPICEMHDPLAAALVVEPDLVEWDSLDVSVTLDGEERGRTTASRSVSAGVGRRVRSSEPSGPGSTRVALRVDVDRARTSLLADLAAVVDR